MSIKYDKSSLKEMATGAAAAVSATAGQDACIRGAPKVTQWKKVVCVFANYIYHTQLITSGSGQINTSAPMKFKVEIAGDMLGRTFLRVVLPPASAVCPNKLALDNVADFFYYVNTVGYAMIDTVSCDIGNACAEKLSGRFLDILDELTTPPHLRMNECVGRFTKEVQLIQAAQSQQVLIVPLHLWFGKRPSSYLPLGAVQLQDISINVNFNSVDRWVVNRGSPAGITTSAMSTIASNTNVSVLVEAVYIDEYQRALFAAQPHTYIIEQVQEEAITCTPSNDVNRYVTQSQALQHNHMAKAFIWAVQSTSAIIDNGVYSKQGVGVVDPFDYSSPDGGESVVDWELRLNNNNINETSILPAMYFRVVTAARAWACIPQRNIYTYPVGENVGSLDVSATIQMSRMDNQLVRVRTRDTGPHTLYFWTFNFNILVLSGGMGGIPFCS